jgi:surface polysaccharide O-acyltransferase-like enzyme
LGTIPWCLNAWCWLLAILGFGMKHLSFSTPFLKYANEAVLPFYILHQTLVLSLAYFVVQWTIADGLKFLVILAGSFAGSIGLYECLVRRNNLMRLLFGMKAKARPLADVRPILAGQGA